MLQEWLPQPAVERRQGDQLLAGSRSVRMCAKSGGLYQTRLGGVIAVAKWWGPDFVQCSQLREAHSTHPRSQISQRISAQDGFIGGNNVYSVVPWTLLLFFGTLIREFLL